MPRRRGGRHQSPPPTLSSAPGGSPPAGPPGRHQGFPLATPTGVCSPPCFLPPKSTPVFATLLVKASGPCCALPSCLSFVRFCQFGAFLFSQTVAQGLQPHSIPQEQRLVESAPVTGRSSSQLSVRSSARSRKYSPVYEDRFTEAYLPPPSVQRSHSYRVQHVYDAPLTVPLAPLWPLWSPASDYPPHP